MLGELRALMKALQPNVEDAPATSAVRRELTGAFTRLLAQPHALDVARETVLRVIDNAAVQRFRNAAAHGEFIRLVKAVTARDHAEEALGKLVSLLPRRNA